MKILHLSLSHTCSHPRVAWKFAYTTYRWGWDAALIALEVPSIITFYGESSKIPKLRDFFFSLPTAPPVGAFFAIRETPFLQRASEAIQIVKKLPPYDIYHLHTPFLLPWVPLLRRYAPKAKILLDLHENPPENWRWDPAYPLSRKGAAPFLAWLLPKFLRTLDGITYAEMGYETLFPRMPSLFLPNAYFSTGVAPLPYNFEWVYSGNLTFSWGVRDFISLHVGDQALLIGHAPQKKFLEWLRGALGKAHILIGGAQQVPYSWIQACLLAAENLWGNYLPLPHFRYKIPTKFYEAVALGKRITYTALPWWEKFFAYYAERPGSCELYWETYEPRLKAFYQA